MHSRCSRVANRILSGVGEEFQRWEFDITTSKVHEEFLPFDIIKSCNSC